jgi:hypothetical protein
MPAMLFRSFSVLACLAMTVATASAQAENPLGEPATLSAPRQSGVNTIVVRALSSTGQPVADLKAEEVTIRTDGRARKIQSLTLVSVPAGGAPAAAAAAAPAPAPKPSNLPAPFSTNAARGEAAGAPGGREFLIILDEEGITAGREEPVRKAVAQLTSNAAPTDRFSLISLRQGGMEIPASAPAVLTDAMTKFVGLGSQREGSAETVCRSQRAMQTLNAVLRASSPGRTIVLVSPGLIATPAGMGDSGIGAPSTLCQIRSNDFDQLAAAAAGSPAAVYVMHYVDGLASASNLRQAEQGLENIAGTANAELLRIGGGSEVPVTRILTETSAYYLATLEAGVEGPVRRVDVRTTRDGVKITARPAGRASGAAAAAAPGKGGKPDDMIRVATVFREVPLRAIGLVSRMPNSKDLMVMALFEPEDPATKLTAAKVALFDEKGSLKANWNAQPKELGSYPVAAAVPIPPGKYRMRVAVNDASGKGGTTDTDVVIGLTDAGPIQFGSLVMGTDPKSPRLQFTSADQQIIGFLPLYGVTKDMKISAVYEVRENETGPPIGATDGNIIDMAGDARMLWGGFGLAPLAPGDYLLRVTVTVNGKEAGVVTRTLRKVQ